MAAELVTWVRETRNGAYGVCIVDGRILVIRKAKGPYKGQYDLPGGGIEFGESPAETVVREFLEETGLAVIAGEVIGAYSRMNRFVGDLGHHIDGHHLGFLYRVTPAPGAQLTVKDDPDGLDSLGALWLPLAEATGDVISPLVAEGLRAHAKA